MSEDRYICCKCGKPAQLGNAGKDKYPLDECDECRQSKSTEPDISKAITVTLNEIEVDHIKKALKDHYEDEWCVYCDSIIGKLDDIKDLIELSCVISEKKLRPPLIIPLDEEPTPQQSTGFEIMDTPEKKKAHLEYLKSIGQPNALNEAICRLCKKERYFQTPDKWNEPCGQERYCPNLKERQAIEVAMNAAAHVLLDDVIMIAESVPNPREHHELTEQYCEQMRETTIEAIKQVFISILLDTGEKVL